jgi:hypothetical protein
VAELAGACLRRRSLTRIVSCCLRMDLFAFIAAFLVILGFVIAPVTLALMIRRVSRSGRHTVAVVAIFFIGIASMWALKSIEVRWVSKHLRLDFGSALTEIHCALQQDRAEEVRTVLVGLSPNGLHYAPTLDEIRSITETLRTAKKIKEYRERGSARSTAARTHRSAVGHGVGMGFPGLELGGKNMLCSPGLAFLLGQDGRLVEQSADAVAPDLGRRMQPAKEPDSGEALWQNMLEKAADQFGRFQRDRLALAGVGVAVGPEDFAGGQLLQLAVGSGGFEDVTSQEPRAWSKLLHQRRQENFPGDGRDQTRCIPAAPGQFALQ